MSSGGGSRSPATDEPDSDSESESSGSDVLPPTSNVRNAKRRRVISTSENESDVSSAESSGTNSDDGKRNSAVNSSELFKGKCRRHSNDGKNSDSDAVSKSSQKSKNGYRTDDSESENICAICLFSISSQQIGTPDTCEHLFCSDCLTEWSNHVNNCPIDRKEFTYVIVRNKIGGKVIKTIPVKPRRISLDDLVEEQPTICQICHSADSEDTMLLCDQCDLGYHMECLDPPLNQVPIDDWYCPECSVTNPNGITTSRSTSTLVTNPSQSSTPSTRSSYQANIVSESLDEDVPSTSTSNTRSRSISSQITNIKITIKTSSRSATRRKVTKRRRKKTRRTNPVVIEYDIKDGEKFPSKIKKRTSKRRRRKTKKVTRITKTVARRTLVKTSVRGRLAELYKSSNNNSRERFSVNSAPQLSLFGNRNELDIVVSEDEEYGSFFNGNGTAVAAIPRSSSSAILEAYRQNRRKTISIPSPTYASSAPDILSSILESQTLFHSKKSSISVKHDGSIIAKLPRNNNIIKTTVSNSKPIDEKPIDLRKSDPNSNAKSAPSYGNSGRGGGNWRGGRGEYGGNNGNRSGRSYSGNTYQGSGSGNYRDNGNYGNNDYNNSGSSYFNSNDSWANNVSIRNQSSRDHYSNIHDRSPQQRIHPNTNRGRGNHSRFSQGSRSQAFPPWQNQNFSDNPVTVSENSDLYPCESDINNTSNISNELDSNYVSDRGNPDRPIENRPLGVYQVSDERVHSTSNISLPQPPIIRFEKPSLSDDEKTEIKNVSPDGDKYDPTEPTIDDSSSEDEMIVRPSNTQNKIKIISPPPASTSEKDSASTASSPSHPTEDMNISHKALDHAVQQVLNEHGGLISGCTLSDEKEEKEMESDIEAECPNFSIYSSTSMDIAKNKEKNLDNEMKTSIEPPSEDLVQEDDIDTTPESGKSSTDLNNDLKLTAVDDQRENFSQISPNKSTYEDDFQNSAQRGNIGLQSKFTPKRNMIKINLSSSFGSKKKNFNSETSKLTNLETVADNLMKLDYNCSVSLAEQTYIHTITSPLNINSLNFVESISDLEDERSYTPCLDENKSVKSKDTSLEDNDKGSTCIEGLDTEMISEDEGNELFSDPNRNEQNHHIVEIRRRNFDSSHHPDFEEGEIVEKNKQKIKEKVKELLEKSEERVSDDDRKKRRRDKKNDKDEKDRNSRLKNKKENENIFKKLSKSGKERNYRERDDKGKGKDKRRSKSTDKENRDKKDRVREKKKEKRKDMERYDVRNIISDKNRRMKDAFGRDKSRPRSNSPSSRSPFRYRRSISRRRSPSRSKRSNSRTNKSTSKEHRSKSPQKITSNSRRRRSMSRGLRSLSKERKSVSPIRKRSNSLKRRSITPKSRESSKKRLSLSPRPRSPILRNKRSVSPKNRRSISPRNRRSFSPKNRRSISPRNRRSISPRNRRSISPRNRRSKSRNRRSISRNRNKRIRRSISRNRRISPKLHRNKSPRRRLSRRSRSKMRSVSRNRSRSPKSKKPRKLKRTRSDSNNRKSKSPVKSKIRRKRSCSFSPGVALSRSLSRERLHPPWQNPEKSPLFQDWTSGSQSMSPGLQSPGLTPPIMEKSPEPQNLRVILTTKEKSKKKEKKKKSNKRNKANERLLKTSKDIGPSKEVFTSGNNILVSVSFNKNKEMDNIVNMTSTEVPTKKKKRKAENSTKQKKEKKEKLKKKRVEKEKRSKEIENKKPVAIIDLDKSPFKELTPSPKAVIVLSDSDNGEKEEEIREIRQDVLREKVIEINFPQPEAESIPNSPNRENNYITSTGPKTPPEPPIKFTIISKSNPQLRSVNPLHEDEDEAIENQEANPTEETTTNRVCEVGHKGPNTPPEPPNSPPSSPDAYDPFEPTKSGSATPERIPNSLLSLSEPEKIPETRPDEISSIPCMSLEAAQKSNLSADDVIQAKPISPTEKVMALLKSTRASLSPSNPMQQIFSDSIYENPKVDPESSSTVNQSVNMLQSPDRSNSSAIVNKVIQPQSTYSAVVKPNSPKPIYSTVAPTVVTSTPAYLNPSVPRIGVFNMGSSPSTQKSIPALSQKITLPSPTKSSPLKSQPSKIFSTKPSPIKSTPIKPMVSSKTLISKLPMPTIKPIPRNQKINKTPNKSGQNGNEIMSVNMDIDSPYSPGSSDFGDLFEPPSDNGKHNVTAPSSFSQKNTNKFESFDSLFSIKPSSKNTKSSTTTKVAVRQIKKSKGKTVGVKVDEDSLKILDDLPSSAVEMQVKTKFLKKLNRQERVVEEVKLVLKPHYNKKHINKEEYKDILRRAVPKICHNRSGEINPAKIQALIEAYVKKFRKKSHISK